MMPGDLSSGKELSRADARLGRDNTLPGGHRPVPSPPLGAACVGSGATSTSTPSGSCATPTRCSSAAKALGPPGEREPGANRLASGGGLPHGRLPPQGPYVRLSTHTARPQRPLEGTSSSQACRSGGSPTYRTSAGSSASSAGTPGSCGRSGKPLTLSTYRPPHRCCWRAGMSWASYVAAGHALAALVMRGRTLGLWGKAGVIPSASRAIVPS